MKTTEGKLVLCPRHVDVKKVLDLGCGTGIWAYAFGTSLIAIPMILLADVEIVDDHPDSEVLAVDRIPMSSEW